MGKTNFERIKEMNIDEMSEFIGNIETDECSGVTMIGDLFFDTSNDIKEWLEKEVK